MDLIYVNLTTLAVLPVLVACVAGVVGITRELFKELKNAKR